ncbi:Tol-Pal system beta propeller repeat protein TolB [Fretibacter rubidus]|uniref:Tol-Pal system beta propeller repeat protein TolB n=1 Tax=Fretibacter rubidus TaxID=570162 RepID=UPI00352B5328
MMRFLTLIFVLLASLMVAVPQMAHAQLKIDITKGNLDPTPIAVPDFMSNNAQGREIGKDLAAVVRADLERSGLFKSLDPASFIETQTNIDYQPTYADWRVIKAEGLVSGRIVMESDSRMRVEFRLWDIFGGSQLSGVRLAGTPDSWKRMAHKVSDAIYSQLTGETGYFDSRIVFIDETGPKTDRRKRLAIMDQDGANAQYLLAGPRTVITPRFSPNAQKITYMSYENIVPQIYLLDIETGRRELLGSFPGMTFAPRFSPDGENMLLSLMKRDNSDIYVMNLRSRSTTQLTTNPGIDVSASFSPDGRQIVFNSDRGGSPQLYVMNADGSGQKRISFGKGRYSAPVWSPRGDKIAFVKSGGGKFGIGVMNPDGSGERLLTESFLDEGPTWSPNGRVILFSRETRGTRGTSQIWSVDLTGQNLRQVPTPTAASDPAWSPLLP